jgi:hypothetical protein
MLKRISIELTHARRYAWHVAQSFAQCVNKTSKKRQDIVVSSQLVRNPRCPVKHGGVMKMLVAGAALATLVAGPAFVQSHSPRNSGNHMSARAAAIHECSARAQRYPEYLWGDMEFQQYRACMAEHGQPE